MKKKFLVLAAVIVLIGIIVVAVRGFKVDYCFKAHKLVYIELGQDFNEKDIKAITDEVFPKENVTIQSAGVYSDNIVLNVNQITDEQKSQLSQKINEKYGVSTTADSIAVRNVPNYRLRDLVKAYIIPMLIAFAVAGIYIIIRFRKLGIVKMLVQFSTLTVIAEVLYFALIAISRFPVNRLVMPGALAIFFILTSYLVYGNEKQLKTEDAE